MSGTAEGCRLVYGGGGGGEDRAIRVDVLPGRMMYALILPASISGSVNGVAAPRSTKQFPTPLR